MAKNDDRKDDSRAGARDLLSSIADRLDELALGQERICALIEELVAVERIGVPRLMTVEDAAVFCSLSVTTIRGLLERGQLTAIRLVSGAVRVERRELDALIDASAGPAGRNSRGRAAGRAARARATGNK